MADKEDIFAEEIAPLLEQVFTIASQNGISLLIVAQLDEIGRGYKASAMSLLHPDADDRMHILQKVASGELETITDPQVMSAVRTINEQRRQPRGVN